MLDTIFQLSRYDPAEVIVLRRNLRAHVLDGVLFGFATSFISLQTVLPVFVQQLGGGPAAIGSVPVLWWLGTNLPQALFLPLTHRGGAVKPLVVRYAFLQRMLFLVLAVVTFTVVGKMFVAHTVAVVLGLLLLIATAGSLAVPPWQQLFVLTTPVVFRGRLMAVRQFISAILGIIAGSITALVLAYFPLPVNFSILFFLCFVLTMCSLYYLNKLKEPEESIGEEFSMPMGAIARRGLEILRADRGFRRFLVADAAMMVLLTAPAFFAVYGMERFNLPVSDAGTFTIITMASMMGANLVVGYVADHYGHKRNLMILSGSLAAACFIAVLAPNAMLYAGVFVFMACALAIQGISRMQLVAELAPAADRPIYFALTNTITAPTVFIGIIAGSFATITGYGVILTLYALLGCFSVYWTFCKVDEPRHKAEATVPAQTV